MYLSPPPILFELSVDNMSYRHLISVKKRLFAFSSSTAQVSKVREMAAKGVGKKRKDTGSVKANRDTVS